MPAKKPLNFNMTPKDMIVTMAEGNPGAVVALMSLLETNPIGGLLDIMRLDDLKLRGPDIWVAFKDHCHHDIEAFRTAIRAGDKDMLKTVQESR